MTIRKRPGVGSSSPASVANTARTASGPLSNRKQASKSREAHAARNPVMSKHAPISPSEAADRLAIRELVEAYAYCADRRDAEGQMSLFMPDTHFVVYMDPKNPTPSQELHSREA